jgi:hypothetical protein
MKRKRFTEKQIAFALRQAESGTAVTEITRKLGVSEQTFYRCKRKYAGLGIFDPVGLSGLVYLYALYAFHRLIFTGMLRALTRAAEKE